MLKKSPLVPRKEGQLLDYETWDEHTSEEHKWEFYDGMPFSATNTYERDRLAVCLVYNMGLRHFLKLLPEQSKKDLKELLEEEEKGE